MKVNSEVGVCNIQSQLQYSAVKQLASDYQKVKAQVTTALMTAGESERLILFFKCQHPIHFFPSVLEGFYSKVTFFHQCSKMQIIPIKNLTFKLVFSTFFGFSD